MSHEIEYARTADAAVDPTRAYAKAPLQKLRDAMDRKLRKNADKGPWDRIAASYLLMRLGEEAAELANAIVGGKSEEEIWGEAADIANFAMMLADNATRKTLRQQIQEAALSVRYENVSVIGDVLHAALLHRGVSAARHVRIFPGCPLLPLAVFELNAVPRHRVAAVFTLSVGQLQHWQQEIEECAPFEEITEIVVITPLIRIANEAKKIVCGDKPVTVTYVGGQVVG